jgi:predicted permease
MAIASILTLALGIGANAAVFSIVNGLLLRPLPYPDGDRLVKIDAQHLERGWTGTDMSVADAWEVRARADEAFEDVFAFDQATFNLTGGDQPEVVFGAWVTWNAFSVLKTAPVIGRGFREEDDREGAPLVTVLGDEFWERRFARDPAVLGSTLMLDGEVATVIGIMPPEFTFNQDRPDLYVPGRMDPLAVRGAHGDEAIGRLRPSVTEAEADRAVLDVARQLQAEFPDSNDGWTMDVVPLKRDMAGDVALQASIVLMVIVGFVLLMACVNVANLLLAHANARRAELAVRAALGAGRGRIVRQLLTESGVLAFFGGAAGILLAIWGNRLIVAALPTNTPASLDFSLDRTVVAFALLVSAASAVVFGLAPALRAARSGATELRSGGRGGMGRGRARFGSSLIVLQTALAVMLLVAGGMMVKSVVGMTRQDFGWEAEGLLVMTLTPSLNKYEDAEAFAPLHEQLLERIRAVPGVESAAAIQAVPLGGSNWGRTFTIPGVPESEAGYPTRVGHISDSYFATMGLQLRSGRAIQQSDRSDAPAVVVVNETFVRRYFPGEDAVGKRIHWGEGEPAEIVGVVQDHLERSVDRGIEASAFIPVTQNPVRRRQIAVRTAGDPSSFADALKQAIWEVDADQPVVSILPMSTLVDRAVAGWSLLGGMMGIFALISLVLGAVGIYGVTAYAVGQRTNEIGIRMAMGADSGVVRGMVVRQGMSRALIGVVAGVVLAALLGQAMAGILVGVSPRDPWTFAIVVLTIVGVTSLGSYIPAMRASRVDPVRALSAS